MNLPERTKKHCCLPRHAAMAVTGQLLVRVFCSRKTAFKLYGNSQPCLHYCTDRNMQWELTSVRNLEGQQQKCGTILTSAKQLIYLKYSEISWWMTWSGKTLKKKKSNITSLCVFQVTRKISAFLPLHKQMSRLTISANQKFRNISQLHLQNIVHLWVL